MFWYNLFWLCELSLIYQEPPRPMGRLLENTRWFFSIILVSLNLL